ncbi:ATP-dependent helicase, partial [Symplocastrum sp. BBK-W-15]|nr:ATP-dependent helicase [Limnofasciculus baicalensis BBK-W-15]
MAILHGSWINNEYDRHLFIWGEMWRAMASVAPPTDSGVSPHPLAMTQAEFAKFSRSHNLSIGKFSTTSGENNSGSRKGNLPPNLHQWQEQIIALPTQPAAKGAAAYPLLSSKIPTTEIDSPPLVLQLWQVEGLCLTPLQAVKFLQSLPLGSFKASDAYVGAELRFWSQICRWSLDLLTRCKFLPGVYRQSNGDVVACWEPLLDSATDRERLAKFIQIMPSACRGYLGMGSGE